MRFFINRAMVSGTQLVFCCCWLVLALALVVTAAPPEQIFDVTDYGATGNGVTKDTNAVIAAFAAAEARGGGLVYFPAGNYLVGSFNMTNNTAIYLDAKATILGSDDPNDYPVIPPMPSYGTGRDMPGPRYASLIHGQNLTNIAVLGTGTINGQGQTWYELKNNGSLLHGRPSVIEFMWSTNIELRNISIINSPFWTVHPVYCENVLVDGISIVNPSDVGNTDGVDPDSSINVVITNNYISVGDDCIAVKSGLDQYGREYNHPTINVTVANNVFGTGHGLTIGSEMSGGVYNVSFINNHCVGTERIVRLKTGITRGGAVKNITYLNITGDSITSEPISLDMNYNDGGSSLNVSNENFPPVITDFLVQNLYIINTTKVGQFQCLPSDPCSNLTFINVNITIGKADGWQCEYALGSATNVYPEMPTGCLANQSINAEGIIFNKDPTQFTFN